MSERVIDPELLRNINIVTSSHNHTDHLDGETLTSILKNNPSIQFIIPESNRDFVSDRLKCKKEFPIGLTDGKSVTIDPFIFHGIPAKHNELERDENDNCKYMGYVFEFGKYKIYHSGDTLWFDGMVEMLKPYNLDVAILPINGNDATRKVAGNLNSREAAELGKAINAQMVIPCHYDMFTFNTADVHEFISAAEKLKQPYHVLSGGGHLRI
jgi:L-ascorbate metabolism protein UlaG (beta-lactamase superfamily)